MSTPTHPAQPTTPQQTVPDQTVPDQSVPSWRRGTLRPLLWLTVLLAAAANIASNFGGLPIVVNLVTGLTLLGAVTALVILRTRDRDR